jgi:hypothetical protein
MEASGAIDPMEGIWLFLRGDALPTTRSLKRTRALHLDAVRTPIDRLVYGLPGSSTDGPAVLGPLMAVMVETPNRSRASPMPLQARIFRPTCR